MVKAETAVMDIFSTVALALQTVLTVKADTLAKAGGFIKRRRKITGANFIKTLVFGWMQNSPPSAEGLARAGFSHGLEVSAQGLNRRFTGPACEFVKSVLGEAMAQVVTAGRAVDIGILDRFEAVHIADCSAVPLPAELEHLWRGTGGAGDAGKAALKLDTDLELKTGRLSLGLLPGRHSDSRGPMAEAIHRKGVLRIQDLGYFNLARMRAQGARGEYWISRLQPGIVAFDADGARVDWPRWLGTLARQGVVRCEAAVEIGAAERLPARLLLWRLPEEAAARRRAKMKDNARKHCRAAAAESLALCDWNLLVTNVEGGKLSLPECFLLYGVRWQIELLFKLWKSHGKLGHSRSSNPHRVLCELYAKLLGVLIQHWLVLTGLWHRPTRSLVKGCQMIKEQSARLACCVDDPDALTRLLKELAERFQRGCSLNPRKKKPNTCQKLINGYEFA
jgi:hypothetical protein